MSLTWDVFYSYLHFLIVVYWPFLLEYKCNTKPDLTWERRIQKKKNGAEKNPALIITLIQLLKYDIGNNSPPVIYVFPRQSPSIAWRHWTPFWIHQYFHLVYPNMCTLITNLWKWKPSWSSKLQENSKIKKITNCCTKHDFRRIIKGFRPGVFFRWEVTSFSKTTLLQREPSHSVFYHQQPFIVRYQVILYAHNYFE